MMRIAKILSIGLLAGALALAACTATRTQRSAGETIDDATITASVKMALIEDPVTKAYQINVDTRRARVQLSGFVDNAEAKAQATTVASGVNGVASVDNVLEVKMR